MEHGRTRDDGMLRRWRHRSGAAAAMTILVPVVLVVACVGPDSSAPVITDGGGTTSLLAPAGPAAGQGSGTDGTNGTGGTADQDDPGPVPGTGTGPGYADTVQTVVGGSGARIVGTDSAPAGAATLAPGIEALLFDFGQRYLGYDYRTGDADRIAGLQPLVTPELFAALAQPLPPALVDALLREQRVVTAEPLAVEPLDVGVFAVSFRITAQVAGGAAPGEDDTTRTLTVTVDGRQLVSDVR